MNCVHSNVDSIEREIKNEARRPIIFNYTVGRFFWISFAVKIARKKMGTFQSHYLLCKK